MLLIWFWLWVDRMYYKLDCSDGGSSLINREDLSPPPNLLFLDYKLLNMVPFYKSTNVQPQGVVRDNVVTQLAIFQEPLVHNMRSLSGDGTSAVMSHLIEIHSDSDDSRKLKALRNLCTVWRTVSMNWIVSATNRGRCRSQ